MTAATVILAAGLSSRMGSPKPLLEMRPGVSFVSHLCSEFLRLGPVVVVVNRWLSEQAGMVPERCVVVVNAAPELGMFSSVKLGVKALGPAAAGAVLFHPVDCPLRDCDVAAQLVLEDTLLTSAGGEENRRVLVPVYRRERGHPLLVPGFLAQRLATMPDTAVLSEAVATWGVAEVDVDEPSVLWNINRPADYEEWKRA